jgi:hypothetical protein
MPIKIRDKASPPTFEVSIEEHEDGDVRVCFQGRVIAKFTEREGHPYVKVYQWRIGGLLGIAADEIFSRSMVALVRPPQQGQAHSPITITDAERPE